VGIVKGDRVASQKQMMLNYVFFGAPQVAIVTVPKELWSYGSLDAGAFVTAFTLVAEALCVATITQAATAGLSPIVREFLSIPDDRNILCAISFGYVDLNHPANRFRTTQAEVREVVTWRS
jgi:nitroreductase